MSNSFTNFETLNLLVPAFGNTRCLIQQFPLAPDNTINFNTVTIQDVPFYPQSVTIDATAVPTTEYVTFTVNQIGYNRIIKGGRTVTFNFPSIRQNLNITVAPSDGISTVKAFFYNFPAFVDSQGDQDVTLSGGVAVNSLPALTGTNRLTVSKIITGAVTTGAVTLISTTTTQTIKIHSLSIVKECSSTGPIVLEVYETGSTPATGAIAMMPIDAAAHALQTRLEPATPKILTLGNDLLYTFSGADTITGNVVITCDYEII